MGDAPKMIIDYGQVKTQEMPDSLVYTLERPTSTPGASDYQTALDAANKNVTSVNNSSFVPVAGASGVGLAQPILQQVAVPVEVKTFDFQKAALFSGAAYLIYKFVFKRGRK